jgi:uncharacterized protein
VTNHEELSWERFGTAARELVRDFCAEHVAEARCAVVYQKPRSTVDCEYIWRRTNRWIDFPWSAPNPPRLAP